ncbi:MAG: hypothetical protein ACW981_20000 [Candidatus Hodarchaeales archaeon]
MNKLEFLKYYLLFFGLLNIFVISFSAPLIFGDILLWQPRNIPVEIMISVLYFSLGIVMVFASKNPGSHKLFIDFVILTNILHALVMLLFITNIYQIIFDVVTIGLMGLIPLLIYPWDLKSFLQEN